MAIQHDDRIGARFIANGAAAAPTGNSGLRFHLMAPAWLPA
jgi:hypothetical protein